MFFELYVSIDCFISTVELLLNLSIFLTKFSNNNNVRIALSVMSLNFNNYLVHGVYMDRTQ